MNLNQFIDIQTKVTTEPDLARKPVVDQSEAAAQALELAKRQSQKPAPVQSPIPTLGAMPVPN